MKYQILVTTGLAGNSFLTEKRDVAQGVRLLQNFNVVRSFPFKGTSLIKTFPLTPVISRTFPERRLPSLPVKGLCAH